MTNRLKILSGTLVISLIMFVNSLINVPGKEKSEKTIINLKQKVISANPISSASSNKNYKSFKSLPDEMKNNTTWSRNPFNSKMKADNIVITNTTQDNPGGPLIKKSDMRGVNALKIESVAIIGETSIVIINGNRYREGDTVNNLTIEKIEREKITFRSGKSQIIRDVGT